MLVTMAVLLILAGIIVSALSSARNRAHGATCLNNLRQHGISLAQFVSENHSYPLNGSHRNVARDPYVWWGEALFPKTESDTDSKTVFDCPAASQPHDFPKPYAFNDYGYNAWGLNGPGVRPLLGLGGHDLTISNSAYGLTFTYGPRVQESEVRNPSGLVAIGDGIVGWGETYEDGKTIFMGRSSSATVIANSNRRVPKRHHGTANMLFADGHVSALPLRLLFQDRTPAALSLWNIDAEPHEERLK